MNKSWIYGIVAAASVATAAPTFAQGIEIGPNGVRVVPQQELRRDDNRSDRAARGEARGQQISERQALRIARGEGVDEVDSVTRTRQAYRVAGVDRRGDDIRVDIDLRSGEVLSVR
ncbi:PepSY domain-containing protein [Antarcticirhabdus aurantiaca]|uniref:PepSY domain-containing protein n=1 Tax=Antarcticirhabdus aurantiaca TaxID=2606717 RepID=A0ACD4NIW2_9HYPH|nr:PepSY domain-containing protein [Antarcticirhabdus aurantiaca]WAJ26732.1 PepSY domain-containing protein [Jeongeuplla avenae]